MGYFKEILDRSIHLRAIFQFSSFCRFGSAKHLIYEFFNFTLQSRKEILRLAVSTLIEALRPARNARASLVPPNLHRRPKASFDLGKAVFFFDFSGGCMFSK